MAGKLTQDEIKWILSIDAKGVNKEIAVTSSEILKLSQANKVMTSDMRAAEKQIKETEKAMEKLTKAGKTETQAYQELKATRDMARADMDDYTRKISENNRTIAENKKKIEELTAGMDLNEMSMRQLRQRAAELKRQLDVTSASANPKEFSALQDELKKVNTRMFDVQNEGKGLMDQFSSMNNPIGSAARAVQGFSQVLKGLIANPVGIVIMAIVAVFYALKTAIAGSDEATTKYEAAVAALGSVLDTLKRNVTEVVAAFINLITLDFKGLKENANNLAEINKNLVDNAKSAWDAAIAEDALSDAIARNNDVSDVNKARIAELRQISRDMTKSIDERKKASKEALRLEEENYKMSVNNISGQYDIWKGKNKNLIDAMKRGSFAQYTEVEKYMQMVQEGTELTYEQRLELARLVNDITTTLDRGTEEEKENFRSFFSEMSSMQEQYFSESRRDVITSSRIEEEARKEALEKRLQKIDLELSKETALLKQQLIDKQITQNQYDKLTEEKSLESLNKKLEIAGLEADKRAEIEQQILDYKIKVIEQEKQLNKEREIVTAEFQKAVMTENERELQAIRDKNTTRLKELREQLDRELITELQYNNYRAIILEEQDKEIEEKQNAQREAAAARVLAIQNKELEMEKMQLMEQYANGLLDKQIYNDRLLNLDEKYALRSLEISNLSDKEKIAARKKLLEIMIEQNELETKKQEEEQKKRVDLYLQFSQQIGETLGGFISGNEDVVKSGLKSIINLALDALKAQVQIAIAGVTAHGLMASGLDPTAMAKAAYKIALIEAAFAAVKGVVNSAFSSSTPTSTNTESTGQYVATGRQSGGYIDVNRAQDGKYFRALLNPRKRGYIDRPTVIVGDGPAGASAEWVASNDALQNATIAPFIQMLDEAQKAGNIRTIDLNHIIRSRMAGFESGGYINRSSPSPSPTLPLSRQSSVSSDNTTDVLKELLDLLKSLKDDGIPASVVLSEVQRKQAMLLKSRKIGSKS